ncbi:MAG: hypothetical protein M0Z78_06550 [Betaproteobacteria bacterium]|nr:hypothetical protein [Betaproteobacteria bacterium]
MSINSIAGDVIMLKSKPMTAALDKPAMSIHETNNQPANQTVQPDVIDTHSKNKVMPAKKSSTYAGNDNKKSGRAMSHIIETYNLQGKLRTKFMDSHNNVIYQIPSEMVAKMEDQMMRSETSTNIKG